MKIGFFAPLLCLCGGCFLITASGDSVTHREPWVGGLNRDGEDLQIRAYRVASSEYGPYDGSPWAIAYPETKDGALDVLITLEYENLDNAEEAGATELPIRESFSYDQYGAFLYITEEDRDGNVLFDHPPGNSDDEINVGTVYLDSTDWTTYIEGRIEAQVGSTEWGERLLDVSFRWGEPDEE
jgi:hypothetical protein